MMNRYDEDLLLMRSSCNWNATVQELDKQIIRGAITKKKRGNLGKIPKGGGVEKTDENSQFQFGNFENPGGGLDFSKMSEL